MATDDIHGLLFLKAIARPVEPSMEEREKRISCSSRVVREKRW